MAAILQHILAKLISSGPHIPHNYVLLSFGWPAGAERDPRDAFRRKPASRPAIIALADLGVTQLKFEQNSDRVSKRPKEAAADDGI